MLNVTFRTSGHLGEIIITVMSIAEMNDVGPYRPST